MGRLVGDIEGCDGGAGHGSHRRWSLPGLAGGADDSLACHLAALRPAHRRVRAEVRSAVVSGSAAEGRTASFPLVLRPVLSLVEGLSKERAERPRSARSGIRLSTPQIGCGISLSGWVDWSIGRAYNTLIGNLRDRPWTTTRCGSRMCWCRLMAQGRGSTP